MAANPRGRLVRHGQVPRIQIPHQTAADVCFIGAVLRLTLLIYLPIGNPLWSDDSASAASDWGLRGSHSSLRSTIGISITRLHAARRAPRAEATLPRSIRRKHVARDRSRATSPARRVLFLAPDMTMRSDCDLARSTARRPLHVARIGRAPLGCTAHACGFPIIAVSSAEYLAVSPSESSAAAAAFTARSAPKIEGVRHAR